MSDANKYWIGFDLGGTKMLCVVLDQEFEIVARGRKKTKGMDGASAGLERISGLILETIGDAGISPDQIAELELDVLVPSIGGKGS